MTIAWVGTLYNAFHDSIQLRDVYLQVSEGEQQKTNVPCIAIGVFHASDMDVAFILIQIY